MARLLPGVAASLLTLGVLGFILYRLDFAALVRALAGARYGYVGPLILTTIVFQLVGALQWRLILSSVKWVGPMRLFAAQMVGALATGVFQLPVGAVVKAYVVARREQVSMSAVLATALSDRLIDGFAFVGLVGVVLGGLPLPPSSAPVQAALRAAGWTSLGLYVGLALLLAGVAAFPGQGAALVERLVGRFAAAPASRIAQLYARFCQGVRLPARRRDRVLLVGCAAVKKAIIPFQVYWVAQAFGLELPWTAYIFQVVFLGFLIVAASAVGVRGTYQAGMAVVLGFYGVTKEIAVAIALIVEVVAHGTIFALGLLFLWREGITRRDLRALAADWRRFGQGA